MRDKKEFFSILESLDGQAVSEYARLSGDVDFSRYVIHNLKIPVVAGGARTDVTLVIHVPQMLAGFPAALYATPIRRTALEDFLARQLHVAVEALGAENGGTNIVTQKPGPVILPRSAIVITQESVEARIRVRLPAREGTIPAGEAIRLFYEEVPAVVNRSLVFCNLDDEDLDRFVRTMEDADQIRQTLLRRGQIAFVAQGAALAVRSLGSTRAPSAQAVSVADELCSEVSTPNGGAVRGLAIPSGVTLLLGDAYSGRAELLDAVSQGIYNHVPGDGRALVVSVPDTVQIVCDGGRPVRRVDISPFLRDVPGRNAREFTTESATPAESQAASVIEALQVGARTLVLDEAASDPAFLTTDAALYNLAPDAGRRVAPLAAWARAMADSLHASILIGASACASEFIAAADTVLLIENFKVTDVTKAAKQLGVAGIPKTAVLAADLARTLERARRVVPASLDPGVGREDCFIETPDARHLTFGRSTIALGGVPQIGDPAQAATVGAILYYAKLHFLDEARDLSELLDLIDKDINNEGLDTLSRELRGDFARPRRFEVAAALNRLPALRVEIVGPAAKA